MLYFIIDYKIGVLVMEDKWIISKLKSDIEERERSYQKELQKIKKEETLLEYIKGMLDITEKNVNNFPYYDGSDLSQEEAEDDFNVMLKYTLKEDKIISSFKAEIKNLYYLEKIGYQHAEQYEETKKKLEEYRLKIKKAYDELIMNETLKKATTKKENILKKLDCLKDKLQEGDSEIENIDSFYEGLQYANLSESEKTEILISVFEKNIAIETKKMSELDKDKGTFKYSVHKEIGKISNDMLEILRKDGLFNRELEEKFAIKITFPSVSWEKAELVEVAKRVRQQVKTIMKQEESGKKNEHKINDRFLIVGNFDR